MFRNRQDDTYKILAEVCWKPRTLYSTHYGKLEAILDNLSQQGLIIKKPTNERNVVKYVASVKGLAVNSRHLNQVRNHVNHPIRRITNSLIITIITSVLYCIACASARYKSEYPLSIILIGFIIIIDLVVIVKDVIFIEHTDRQTPTAYKIYSFLTIFFATIVITFSILILLTVHHGVV